MIKYKCYKVKELLELLGNDFRIINEKVEENWCDWCCGGNDVEKTNKFYLTKRNDIKEIVEWHGLWLDIVVKLLDETSLKLHSSNINSDDKTLLRINTNNFLSPAFKRQNDYILANKDLDEWLLYNGVTEEGLDAIVVEFCLYPTFVYKDIYEPIIRNEEITGSYCTSMKIKENEIDKALKDIKDVQMRLKIERVLKSFEKKYE